MTSNKVAWMHWTPWDAQTCQTQDLQQQAVHRWRGLMHVRVGRHKFPRWSLGLAMLLRACSLIDGSLMRLDSPKCNSLGLEDFCVM